MQVDEQQFLSLVEETNRLAFVDIECLNLKADYGSTLCVSIKPFGCVPYTYSVKQVGNDQRLIREVSRELETYACWVTYFGKGFDLKFLRSRALKWGIPPVAPRHHLDLFFTLKANLLTSRKSQGHLLGWLRTPESKLSVSASDWSEIPFKLKEHMPTMIKRCESDVTGLEALYRATKHIVKDIKRG
jgi:uncharacterized protein YprB with RNaseH-like and TPR domain